MSVAAVQSLPDYVLIPAPVDLAAEATALIRDLVRRSTDAATSPPNPPSKAAPPPSPDDRQVWTREELLYLSNLGTNVSGQRFLTLMDHFAEHPGKSEAMSRQAQAAVLNETETIVDNVYTQVAYWTRRDLGRDDCPLKWIPGESLVPQRPSGSYRYMEEDVAAMWRQARRPQ